jgi:hypothetical protein
MQHDASMTGMQARIDRLESQLKAFRFVFLMLGFVLLSQIFWLRTNARATQAAETMRASRFEVVNAAGETVAELGQKNGGTQLVLYGNSHQPAGEFSVTGLGARIVFYDKEQKPRAALGMEGAPTLVMHDARGDVRALLTADDTPGSVFWVKDKDGFAAVLGNAADETRKIERVDGKEVSRDTVQRVAGVTIRIQDAQRKVLWTAP